MANPNPARHRRKERVGEVISDKMTRTIVVRVQRRFPHPRFKKVVTRYTRFYAHDPNCEARIGDLVRIQETRPLSKSKRWRLVQVLERNREAASAPGPAAAANPVLPPAPAPAPAAA